MTIRKRSYQSPLGHRRPEGLSDYGLESRWIDVLRAVEGRSHRLEIFLQAAEIRSTGLACL